MTNLFILDDYVNATNKQERIKQIYKAIESINNELKEASLQDDQETLVRGRYALNELIREWQETR